jgi:hypothetical protein
LVVELLFFLVILIKALENVWHAALNL